MGGFFQQSSSGNGQVYYNIAFSCLKAKPYFHAFIIVIIIS